MNFINSITIHIQFTVELESNQQLPYLDLLINRQSNGSLIFQIYRKTTHTDRYHDYNSNHPLGYKRSVVNSLEVKAQRLCSEQCLGAEQENIKKKKTLASNSYHPHLVSSTIESANHR